MGCGTGTLWRASSEAKTDRHLLAQTRMTPRTPQRHPKPRNWGAPRRPPAQHAEGEHGAGTPWACPGHSRTRSCTHASARTPGRHTETGTRSLHRPPRELTVATALRGHTPVNQESPNRGPEGEGLGHGGCRRKSGMWGSSVGPAASVMSVRAGSDLEKSRPDRVESPREPHRSCPRPRPREPLPRV